MRALARSTGLFLAFTALVSGAVACGDSAQAPEPSGATNLHRSPADTSRFPAALTSRGKPIPFLTAMTPPTTPRSGSTGRSLPTARSSAPTSAAGSPSTTSLAGRFNTARTVRSTTSTSATASRWAAEASRLSPPEIAATTRSPSIISTLRSERCSQSPPGRFILASRPTALACTAAPSAARPTIS